MTNWWSTIYTVPLIKLLKASTLTFLLVALGLIPCKVTPVFEFEEQFIPMGSIRNDVESLSPIRLIQLLNWPMAKKKIQKKYPMLESVSLYLPSFPQLAIRMTAKKPWAMIVNKEYPILISRDGLLLNTNLEDVELPDERIMMVHSTVDALEGHHIRPNILHVFQQISSEIDELALFNLQQVMLTDEALALVEENGIRINFGQPENIKNKFRMLKYFWGTYRKELKNIQLIDLKYPKRVIIKYHP